VCDIRRWGFYIRQRNVTIVGSFYYLYSYMFGSYDHLQVENILLARITVVCERSGDGGFYIRLRNVTIVG
jgi:hypothetical protein